MARQLKLSLLEARLFFPGAHTVFCMLVFFAFGFGGGQDAIGGEALSPELTPHSLTTSIENTRIELKTLQGKLSSQLLEAQKLDSKDVQLLSHQQVIVGKFVFSQMAEVKDNVLQGQSLEVLLPIKERYDTLLKKFNIIAKTFEAEGVAEYTQKESRMFYKMKMQASKPPSTALKAYGLMGLAKRNRDQGLFLDALKQWRRAEVMIVEAKMEYLADRAKRRKAWEKSEKVKEIERNERVRAMLDSELVLIPAGSFKMGSQNGGTDEMPVKDVKIDRFKMGETEVTFDLWEMCVDGGGCLFVPKDHGWGTGSQPVVGVSHRDIHMRFLPWLHKVTGKPYRLPTESEWEYAARAGSSSEYSWGDKIHCGRARYDGGPTSACNAYEVNRKGPVEVKSYKPNAFGLYDMHGNVWEWVADCWANTYKDTVVGGSARLAGNCKVRVLRGGSWDYSKNGLRSANRYYAHFKTRRSSVGFRLVLGVDDDK